MYVKMAPQTVNSSECHNSENRTQNQTQNKNQKKQTCHHVVMSCGVMWYPKVTCYIRVVDVTQEISAKSARAGPTCSELMLPDDDAQIQDILRRRQGAGQGRV